jgi:hypothetical protein
MEIFFLGAISRKYSRGKRENGIEDRLVDK